MYVVLNVRLTRLDAATETPHLLKIRLGSERPHISYLHLATPAQLSQEEMWASDVSHDRSRGVVSVFRFNEAREGADVFSALCGDSIRADLLDHDGRVLAAGSCPIAFDNNPATGTDSTKGVSYLRTLSSASTAVDLCALGQRVGSLELRVTLDRFEPTVANKFITSTGRMQMKRDAPGKAPVIAAEDSLSRSTERLSSHDWGRLAQEDESEATSAEMDTSEELSDTFSTISLPFSSEVARSSVERFNCVSVKELAQSGISEPLMETRKARFDAPSHNQTQVPRRGKSNPPCPSKRGGRLARPLSKLQLVLRADEATAPPLTSAAHPPERRVAGLIGSPSALIAKEGDRAQRGAVYAVVDPVPLVYIK